MNDIKPPEHNSHYVVHAARINSAETLFGEMLVKKSAPKEPSKDTRNFDKLRGLFCCACHNIKSRKTSILVRFFNERVLTFL